MFRILKFLLFSVCFTIAFGVNNDITFGVHNDITGDAPSRPTSTSSENCPYGTYFMDKCANACHCDASSRHSICTRIVCNAKQDTCPYGPIYYHEKNATCFCNEDRYQTYECFLD